jgi:hypothetical protein
MTFRNGIKHAGGSGMAYMWEQQLLNILAETNAG